MDISALIPCHYHRVTVNNSCLVSRATMPLGVFHSNCYMPGDVIMIIRPHGFQTTLPQSRMYLFIIEDLKAYITVHDRYIATPMLYIKTNTCGFYDTDLIECRRIHTCCRQNENIDIIFPLICMLDLATVCYYNVLTPIKLYWRKHQDRRSRVRVLSSNHVIHSSWQRLVQL